MVADVIPITKARRKADLDAPRARTFAARRGDERARDLLDDIIACKNSRMDEMSRLAKLSDRYDDLYYPNTVLDSHGADHNMRDPNLNKIGSNHLSLNTYPVYVDVPAALLSVVPVENILPADPTGEGADEIAAMVERVYFAWKEKVDFELKSHKAAVTKGLYGRCAAKVYWDPDKGYPCIEIIDQPRNLWLGWSDSDYTRLDWAIYAYRMTPQAILREFGLDVTPVEDEGTRYPSVGAYVPNGAQTYDRNLRDWTGMADFGMVEIHDFWYLRPAGRPEPGKRTRMETWNAILVGDYLLKDARHEEYDGQMPYVPVFNTYIPGAPEGRSAFYDIEQIMREKEQRLAAGGAMISKAITGQFWQLTGQDAPDRVPVGLKPKPNEVIAPGAGNRVEKIEPWMPEFQLEQYLDRLDRELVDISGLNDLLRGLAPAQVLSSSKAINALVANYEARISMGREMFYRFRVGCWDLTKKVWGSKVARMKRIFEAAGRLVVTNPSLTPRDDMETAQMAMNLLQTRVWTLSRAMDATGVEDPEAEKELVREERTDAALFPADVQTQAALMATFQQMGLAQQQMQQQMQPTGPQAMGDAAMAARMAQAGGSAGVPSMNGAGEQPMTPEMPGNVGDGALAALMSGIQTGPGFNAVNQTMIREGEPQSRILLQQPIAPEEG